MALQSRSPSVHKHILGQRIRHPPSTKFDEEFPTPEAKRLKRLDSSDSVSSLQRHSEDEADEPETIKATEKRGRIVPDSEGESEIDDEPGETSRKTDLESALPPVKTDKEAIQEYEATRAAETADLGLNERLGQRKWIQGKSSIYVDAFNLALETVLDEESHLFNEAEIALFENWRSLSYEGQYLYVLRLVLKISFFN